MNERLSLHCRNLRKPLRDALVDVVGVSLGSQDTGIHAEQRDPSGERIRKRLEDERGERFVVCDLARDFRSLHVLARDGTSRDGIGHVVHDSVQDIAESRCLL